MDPATHQKDTAKPVVTKPLRETSVAAMATTTPANNEPAHDAITPRLRALLGDDTDLRLWLQHTGFFDPEYRQQILRSVRKIRAVDVERDKLVLDLRESTGGLFQVSPLSFSPSFPSPPSSLSTFTSAGAGFDAGATAAAATAVRLTPDGLAQVAPSDSFSTATSSVADSVSAISKERAEERTEERGTGPEEVPSPLAQARLCSGSGIAARGRADTRFFLVKCFDSANIYMSQRDGLWATQAKNGIIFTEAFAECQSVVLFFSINKSRAFQGFARMTSAPDATLPKPDWISKINLSAVTEPFRIEWISTAETEFDSVGDLKNPLNEFRSVVVGRDGQEYSPDCGRKMMALLNRQATRTAPPAAVRKPGKAGTPRFALADHGRQARARGRSPRRSYDGARLPSQWRRRQPDLSASR
ncbi:YT521-B-like family protein [Ophiocordyceps sinensis CO18]|nr:YT521-B-like family protein [Ophiocordyceps sinensis CO18]